MELAAIVYSTLAIVFFVVLILVVISYLGYRIKQKESPWENPAMNYRNYRADTRVTNERKIY